MPTVPTVKAQPAAVPQLMATAPAQLTTPRPAVLKSPTETSPIPRQQGDEPSTADVSAHKTSTNPVTPAGPSGRVYTGASAGLPARRYLAGINLRVWMLVLPVDVLALLIPIPFNWENYRGLLVMAALTVILFANGNCYQSRLHVSILDLLPALAGRLVTAAGIVAGITALRHDSMDPVDGFLRSAALATLLVLIGRTISSWVISIGRRRQVVAHPTILVGAGPVAAELAQILRRYPRYGLSVIGYIDDRYVPDPGLAAWQNFGRLSNLADVIRARKADVLLIADPEVSNSKFADLLRGAIHSTTDVLVVPRVHQLQTQDGQPDHIGAIPVMRMRAPKLNGWRWTLKRTVDIIVSAVALILLAPLLAVLALAVRLEGGRGFLFRQERVGRDGKRFNVLKFRSMRPANAADSAQTWSIANDKRVGPVGKILRRSSLDELPQLWNILRGDMTLVGPRPERPHFVEVFSAEHQLYAHRHRVPAGLTGLAQVSGLRGDTPISDRARFDNYYIENWSLWLDFKIIIRTLHGVFTSPGS